MTRTHLLTALPFLAVVACSEHKWPATGPVDTTPPIVTAYANITGIVVVRGSGTDRSVHVLQADGAEILIVGSESPRLASVEGGEVLVRGTWDASPGLVVDRFQVLAMNGRAALDGMLEETAEGYALRLADDSLRLLTDPPAEIADHVGARIWLIGSVKEPPVVFGVIDAI